MLNLDIIRFAKLVDGYLIPPRNFLHIGKVERRVLPSEEVNFSETQ